MADSENRKFLLEEFVREHSHLIKRRVPEVEKLEAVYSEVLDNYTEDTLFKEMYLHKVKFYGEQYELFKKHCQYQDTILTLMEQIHEIAAPYDKRNPDCTIFRVDVVLMVILLAGVCNKTDGKQYKNFWFEYNPLLQFVIPGMPSPRYMISESTINMILRLLPDDSFEKLFRLRFSKAVTMLNDIIELKRNEEFEQGQHFLPTYGGDGQELRASFRRGEPSRKRKGAHGVTLFDTDHRTVVDYTSVKYKNNEVYAFKKMLDRMSADQYGTFIFYADALNTREDFISYLNDKGIPWFFPIKTNNANESLHDAIKLAFITHPKGYKHVEESKTSGRIETRTYRMLPIGAVDTDNTMSSKAVLMVKKHTEYYIKDAKEQREPSDSVIFYITSLEYNEQTFRQLIHSLSRRWLYEQSHNVLDVVMFQDQRALCDDNHLAETIGLNKCIFNIITYARQKLTEQGADHIKHRLPVTKNRRPISYKQTFQRMEDNPLRALMMILDYLDTQPVLD